VTKSYMVRGNKEMLLRAVQDHLAQVVGRDFDGNLIITVRKGYMGRVRSQPRKAQDVFDPYDEIQDKKLLIETNGK